MSSQTLFNGGSPAPPHFDPEIVQLQVGDVKLPPLWVLEWSQSQQAFHTETIVEAIQSNIMGFLHEGKTGDYVILGLFPSREAVDEYYNMMVSRMSRWGLSHITVDDLLDDESP